MTASHPAVDIRPVGPFSAQHRALSAGIFALILCIAFEFMAVATALPVAARELGGLGLFPWALSAFLAAAMFANGVAGELSDRVGPRLPVLVGSVAFTAGLLVSGLSATMAMLIFGRVVQGLGAGFTIVGVYVIIGQCYPDELRPRVMSLLSTAWVVPSVIGPFVAGGLTELISWRLAFLILVPLTPLPLLLVLPRIQSTTATGVRRPARVVLAAAMAGGAALLQWAGLLAEHRRWLAGAAAFCLGAAFVVLAARRLFPAGTLRLRRGLPSVVAFRGVIAGGFFGCEAYIPLMLVEHRGASPTMAGLAVACTAAGWSAGSAWQGRPGLRMRRSGLVRLGSAVTACGVLVAASAAVTTDTVTAPAWLAAVGLLVGGLGMGLSMSSNAVLLLDYSPPGEQGTNSAALQMSDSLGGVLVIGGAGVLYSALRTSVSATEVFTLVFSVAFVVTGLAACVSFRVRSAAFPTS
ncbi:MAG: MFS transporter [Nocardioidaceae bacterium]